MDAFFQKIKIIFNDKSLRNKILFTILALVAFRLFAAIPIPGIDALRLERLLSNNQFLGILNVFSGGGLSNLSIMMLGVGPYITSSIIMQLLTIMIPKLKAMYHEEGDAGRKKFSQYSRIFSIPLAAIQGFSLLTLLERQGVLVDLTNFDRIMNVIVVMAGCVLLMWIGELITEYGIGNGVSLIIFAGIVSAVPSEVSQLAFTFDPTKIVQYLGFIIIGLIIVAGVVVVTEAERPIPVTYAKRIRGAKMYGGVSTYIPLRLNQAGVIPIIFALSILLFPQMIVNFVSGMSGPVVQHISSILTSFLQNTWLYSIFYFFLVFLFTYFYTAVTFDPNQLSENLQKNGAFILGIRPGKPTSIYIAKILNRITLVGGAFLGIIAVLPLIIKSFTGITSLAIGGTALLIVVSVVLDLIKRIDAQISMREY